MNFILLGIEAFVAFAATLVITPRLIKAATERGFVGSDVHKLDKPLVAEMGGIAIFSGYILALLIAIYFAKDIDSLAVMAGVASIILVVFIGLIDDLFAIPQSVKLVLPIFAAIPLMVTEVGTTTMLFPIVGPVQFGVLYSLVLIPIGITAASNLTNMLAGYNGLEAASGIIAGITVLFGAVLLNRPEAAVFIVPLIFSLLAFLFFNKYPAKIFMGDSGTLMIGCVIAVAVITGNMELVGALALSLHIVNFLLYIFNVNKFRKNSWKFSKPDKEGYLHPPAPECIYSVYFFIESKFNAKEQDVVFKILLVQAVISAAVIGWLAFEFLF